MTTSGWTTSTYAVPDGTWPAIEARTDGRRIDGKKIPRRLLVAAAVILLAEDPKLLERAVKRAARLAAEPDA